MLRGDLLHSHGPGRIPQHLLIRSEVTQGDLRPEMVPLVSQPVVWKIGFVVGPFGGRGL